MLDSVIEMEDIWQTLVEDEGYEDKPYRDSRGIWTFGVGRNLESPGLSREEVILGLQTDFHGKEFIRHLFVNDIKDRAVFLRSHYPWMLERPWPIRKAMLCMAFQLGKNEFQNFGPTITCIENKDNKSAEIRLRNTKWYQQTPKRVERVINLLNSANGR